VEIVLGIRRLEKKRKQEVQEYLCLVDGEDEHVDRRPEVPKFLELKRFREGIDIGGTHEARIVNIPLWGVHLETNKAEERQQRWNSQKRALKLKEDVFEIMIFYDGE
jgi:hypothetical protein